MKNTANTVRTITEIGIFAALGFVFDELQGILFKGVFINGGSIGFAMIAVLIIAYRRGVLAALATGLIMGLLDVATSAYILHPMQLLLDYIFPYAVVGFASLFKPLYDKAENKGLKITWLVVGTVVGGLLKFLSHYLAGVIFWADPANFAWDLNSMNPYLYCFIYNIAFIGPSIVITGALLILIQTISPRILTNKAFVEDSDQEKGKKLPIAVSSVTIAGGVFLFIYFLVKYIKSFYDYKDGSAYGYDFDPDAMVIFVVGLFLIVLGAIALYKTMKGKFSYAQFMGGFTVISLTSFVYGLARLIRTYVKNKSHDTYWLWVIIASIVLVASAALFVVTLLSERKQKQSNI